MDEATRDLLDLILGTLRGVAGREVEAVYSALSEAMFADDLGEATGRLRDFLAGPRG
jgi:hypothetical protein